MGIHESAMQAVLVALEGIGDSPDLRCTVVPKDGLGPDLILDRFPPLEDRQEAFFVEFPNDDVGPFRTEEDAEAYRRFEGNLDETQVFSSTRKGRGWIDLRTFCPGALITPGSGSLIRSPRG